MKVFIDGHGKCEVWKLPKMSSPRQRKYRYAPESFTHPAKMHVGLCRKIIETYTKHDEIVLDPMCGVSTTQIEAALLGRNAVGVDLESKFIKITKNNIRLLKKLRTLAPKGEAVVLKGDARKLSELLQERADSIVFSPPYAKTEPAHDLDFQKKRQLQGKLSKDNVLARYHHQSGIGTLPYGKCVDAIVTSPPFASSIYHLRNKPLKFWKKLAETTGRKAWLQPDGTTRKTQRAKDEGYKGKHNIGNLPYGIDAVVFSPPFKTSNEGGGLNKNPPKTFRGVLKKHSFKLSENPANIDNKPYGSIDAIVTSPPYVPKGDRRVPWGHEHGALEKDDKKRGFKSTGGFRGSYGDNSKNIGNPKKYGSVDAIITSPPYAGMNQGPSREPFWEKLAVDPTSNRFGRKKHPSIGEEYSKSKKNIGNLPHGQVDAIVTSPPYSEGTGHGGGRDNIIKEKRLYLHGKGSYSKERENIGHLKHGQVNSVIFSPPYHDNKSDWDRKSRAAKEGETVAYLDEVGRERENIGNIHYYDQGDPLSHKYAKAPKGSETYLSAMLQVYAECFKVLKSGGLMVLVIKDFIRNKKVVRLDLDTKRLCEAAGFWWVETKLFRLQGKSFWRVLYEQKHPEVDTSLLRYEFVEVFQKPLEVFA